MNVKRLALVTSALSALASPAFAQDDETTSDANAPAEAAPAESRDIHVHSPTVPVARRLPEGVPG